MDRFAALQVFSQVVESGSFAKAAARLGLSTSAASRHIAELEAHLQTRLLNRTTRRVSLTESGRAFYERSIQLLADLEEAEQEAARAAVVPRGTIKLTASVNFGVRHIAPAIAAFLAQHREVRFDVSLSDRVVDLVEEGFDLGIRIGVAGSGNIVARKLGETRLVPCASPGYIQAHGAPQAPEELEKHNCFTYEYVTPRNLWRFRDPSGHERAVRVRGSLHSNNGDLLAEAAARGAGIVFEPAFIVGPDVRTGRLVPLLLDFVPLPAPIYAVYPSRKHLSAKVRLFVDFLVERFAEAQDSSVLVVRVAPKADVVHTLTSGRAREEYEPPLSENDPMYFVLGARSGYSARFQLSFKYRLFDQSVGFGQDRPWLSGLYFGYTQNSLWDLSAQSKPFRDTSYRPSLFWKWERADDKTWIDAARFGIEHESNGKDGDRSRSINMLFIRPEWHWRLRDGDSFQFTPHVHKYFDKGDNPDIAAYRGYVDWRARYDANGEWIATGVARIGTSGKGSLLIDFSKRTRNLRRSEERRV